MKYSYCRSEGRPETDSLLRLRIRSAGAAVNRMDGKSRSGGHGRHAKEIPKYAMPRTNLNYVAFHMSTDFSVLNATAGDSKQFYPFGIRTSGDILSASPARASVRILIPHFAGIAPQKLWWALLLALASGIASGVVASHFITSTPVHKTPEPHAAVEERGEMASVAPRSSTAAMRIEEVREALLGNEKINTDAPEAVSRLPQASGRPLAKPYITEIDEQSRQTPVRTTAAIVKEGAAPVVQAQAGESVPVYEKSKPVNPVATQQCSPPMQALGLCSGKTN